MWMLFTKFWVKGYQLLYYDTGFKCHKPHRLVIRLPLIFLTIYSFRSYLAKVIPHAYVEHHRDSKKNVWCVFSRDRVFRQLSYTGNTSSRFVWHSILNSISFFKLKIENRVSEPDGVPPHYGDVVCYFLDKKWNVLKVGRTRLNAQLGCHVHLILLHCILICGAILKYTFTVLILNISKSKTTESIRKKLNHLPVTIEYKKKFKFRLDNYRGIRGAEINQSKKKTLIE